AIFVAQEVQHLLVEHLPCELPGLREHHTAIFRVGVVTKIRSLIDEALTVCIQHDAERVRVLLEAVADGKIAELRRVSVPADRVPAGPVAIGHGADVERHLDTVAGIETRAAHLRELPAGAEVARAPLAVRLETAGGEHYRLRAHIACPSALAHPHAANPVVVDGQRKGARLKGNGDVLFPCRRSKRRDQPRSAAYRLDRKPAPEL